MNESLDWSKFGRWHWNSNLTLSTFGCNNISASMAFLYPLGSSKRNLNFSFKYFKSAKIFIFVIKIIIIWLRCKISLFIGVCFQACCCYSERNDFHGKQWIFMRIYLNVAIRYLRDKKIRPTWQNNFSQDDTYAELQGHGLKFRMEMSRKFPQRS